MGYELRMHIHDEGALSFKSNNAIHGIEIARLDLSKIGYTGALFDLISHAREGNTPGGAFFADDGNSLIDTDRYGTKLIRIPAEEVLNAIEATQDDYRRFVIAKALLKSCIENFGEGQLYCYFFGH